MAMSSIKALLASGAALAFASSLSGCASQTTMAAVPPLSVDAHKVPVTVQPEQLMLTPHAQGLSSAQSAAVYDMVGRWQSAAGGQIVIETPNGGGADARTAGARVGDSLRQYGVAATDIQMRGYDGDARAPIKVTFPIYEAQLPQCGLAWENLARAPNHVPDNFGCAMAANIAAMAANPADLTYARPAAPIDATRRQNVLERYRQGAPTSSAKEVSSSTGAAGGGN
jgi:pilus assembly protein CpaD